MNSFARNLWILLALVGNLGNARSFAQLRANQGLQVQLSQASAGLSSPRFLVHLKNLGDHDLMLNLGTMLGNGSKQYLDAIHFSLTSPSGVLLSLDLTGPAIVAGRVDPLIVPLPVGAQYTFPVDLNDYCACKQNVWELGPLHGHYLLQANFQGTALTQSGTNSDMWGITLSHIWTGQASSRTLSFYVRKEPVKPTHH